MQFPFKGTSSCVVKRDGNALLDCVVKRLYNQSNERVGRQVTSSIRKL